MTAGELRRWLRSHPEEDGQVERWRADPDSPAEFCTVVETSAPPDPHDGLVANCMPQGTALRYCRSLGDGSDLPSEAQFEYAASALGQWRYPWGDDDPLCGDAVFAIAGNDRITECGWNVCRPLGSAGGPRRPASSFRDRVVLDGKWVADLAGNVSEWVLDGYQPYGGDFWHAGILGTDPVCPWPSQDYDMTRGGSFLSSPEEMAAGWRRATSYCMSGNLDSVHIGFRCVRPAR